MNSNEILKKLSSFILTHNLEKNLELKDTQWKTEESTTESILFYSISDTLLAKDAFYQRMKNTDYGVLITDRINATVEKQKNYIVVQKESWLECQKIICDLFYPYSLETKLIGITGTNGKTTTADLVLQLGTQNHLNVLTVGTLGLRDKNGVIVDLGLTTPPYIEIRKIIHQYEKKYNTIVFEVSSHALEQGRVYEINFHAAAWTNLTQDHLDYHQTFENYFKAKEKILNHLHVGSHLLIPEQSKNLLTKLKKEKIIIIKKINFQEKIPPFLESSFNQVNYSLACALLCEITKLNKKDPMLIKPTPGRFHLIDWNERKIIIDFAHTPDALLNIGQAIKEAYPKRRVVTVFGCGGNRDKKKRPLMGEAVSSFSDLIYLTNDNPRDEEPLDIINDILPAISKEHYIEVERKKAIKKAMENSTKRDVILIAGKGHEDYMIIKGKKISYSDEASVQDVMRYCRD